jgi:hypothetical protein
MDVAKWIFLLMLLEGLSNQQAVQVDNEHFGEEAWQEKRSTIGLTRYLRSLAWLLAPC